MADANQKPLSASKVNDENPESGWNFPRNRCSATDPTPSDDETQGFWYGSIWVNYSSPSFYFCIDPSEGAAIWQVMANG